MAGLAGALQRLVGTDLEEQVFIVPTIRSQSWHLDVVQLDEGYGDRFAVYAEYGGDISFDQRGLLLPEGSEIDADEGSNVTGHVWRAFGRRSGSSAGAVGFTPLGRQRLHLVDYLGLTICAAALAGALDQQPAELTIAARRSEPNTIWCGLQD